jgi:hypothetical protein
MKCIKKGAEIKRVKNDVANIAVEEDGWSFCPKSEWKTKVRDVGKVSRSQKKKAEAEVASDDPVIN